MPDSEDFFKNIPAHDGFENTFNPDFRYAAPQDWHAVITDIKDSSKAINAGQYKQVNIAGASCIVAVLNAAKNVDIPYIFGGDGASFLIPLSLIGAVSEALLATKEMIRELYNLDLRVGSVPVKKLYEDGKTLRVSKFRISENACIAMFHEGGLAYAEKLIKETEQNNPYLINSAPKETKADFNGLECRWNPIAAKKDYVLTLMVKTRANDAVYKELVRKIDALYGGTQDYHPVKSENLNLSLQAKNLRHEFDIKTHKRGPFSRAAYALKMLAETAFAKKILLAFDLAMGDFEGRKYVQDVSANTDFRKFDDTFRIILDSTKIQHQALQDYLDEEYRQDKLFYGINISSSVMMTCLVFHRKENHIHFVDGMAGGYTDAAQKMKRQMAVQNT